MQTVNFLAQWWGFSLAIISFSLLLKPKNISHFFGLIEDTKNLLPFGIVNLIAGIALVLTYNVWALQWQVVVTILGWAVLVRGLALLLVPETVVHIAHSLRKAGWIHPLLAALVSLGSWLAYMGMFR